MQWARIPNNGTYLTLILILYINYPFPLRFQPFRRDEGSRCVKSPTLHPPYTSRPPISRFDATEGIFDHPRPPIASKHKTGGFCTLCRPSISCFDATEGILDHSRPSIASKCKMVSPILHFDMIEGVLSFPTPLSSQNMV